MDDVRPAVGDPRGDADVSVDLDDGRALGPRMNFPDPIRDRLSSRPELDAAPDHAGDAAETLSDRALGILFDRDRRIDAVRLDDLPTEPEPTTGIAVDKLPDQE